MDRGAMDRSTMGMERVGMPPDQNVPPDRSMPMDSNGMPVSSKGNILCRLIKIELYKIFAIINRAIKGLHCMSLIQVLINALSPVCHQAIRVYLIRSWWCKYGTPPSWTPRNKLNFLVPGRTWWDFKKAIFNPFSLIDWYLQTFSCLMIIVSDECPGTLLMI